MHVSGPNTPPSGTSDDTTTMSPSPTEPRPIRPRKPQDDLVSTDLNTRVSRKGSHIGDKYIKVVRRYSDDLRRVRQGYLIAAEEKAESKGPVGRLLFHTKRALIGAPLTNAAAAHERLSNVKALAVLSSDALSSVAYATEEILRVLLIAGMGALVYNLGIGAAIIALMIIVGLSYRQTIKAYPHGGGSYIVAHDNLGETPALVAGGALLIDYTLTVAVSVSSGVAAIVSAFPSLHNHLVLMGVSFVALITLINLRGIRESGTFFAIPTYLFLIGLAAMLAIGFVRNMAEGFTVHPPSREVMAGTGSITIFLILRAFSSGCSAMTGVEAISDGVPAFRPPEWINARKTLTAMIIILTTMFAGITFLSHQYGAIPLEQSASGYETVVSQIARGVFGGKNVAYYYLQIATMAILIMAANTAYSDFPRLAYFMARDKYMPSQFTFRGDRLAYTFGIVTLGAMSIIVMVIFGAQVERLIPLYAFGVFTSFTLSQLGMVVRWQRRREPGWMVSRVLNALGAAVTGMVAIVVGMTKFTHGAWIVILLIPIMVSIFKAIHRHYVDAAREMAVDGPVEIPTITNIVVVPFASVNRITLQTLAYAQSISKHITAVHVTDDAERGDEVQAAWTSLKTPIPLTIIESPYRSLVGPLLNYIGELQAQAPNAVLTVVLPEYVPSHFWEQMLHNQTALRIKAALLFRPGVVVTSVPYHRAKSSPTPHWQRIFMRRI